MLLQGSFQPGLCSAVLAARRGHPAFLSTDFVFSAAVLWLGAL